jgi:hypothetical protein
MLPPDVLSGNLVVETTFLSESSPLYQTCMRIYYD